MINRVEILTMLVDGYIADLTSALTDLKIMGMAKGRLSIIEESKVSELTNRLNYVKYKKEQALTVDVFPDSNTKTEHLHHNQQIAQDSQP